MVSENVKMQRQNCVRRAYLSHMKKDDSLWKGLLEDLFEEFLLFVFKEQAAIFDTGNGFEFLNNELAQIFSDR